VVLLYLFMKLASQLSALGGNVIRLNFRSLLAEVKSGGRILDLTLNYQTDVLLQQWR
jgi:hypothetical protein